MWMIGQAELERKKFEGFLKVCNAMDVENMYRRLARRVRGQRFPWLISC